MTNLKIKTDEGLLQKLAEAAKRKLTDKEIEKQRISIIFAGLPHESAMSKIDIEKVLKKAS